MRLVHWLLVAMVDSPTASFTQHELCRQFSGEFDAARRACLIEEVRGPVDYVADDAGRRRRVVVEGLRAVLIDEDDPEQDLERWPLDDVRCWRAEPTAVIDCLRARHALEGGHGLLRPDVWLLGRAGERREVVLALAGGDRLLDATEYARGALPADSAIVMLTPTGDLPLATREKYKSKHIGFGHLQDDFEVSPELDQAGGDFPRNPLSWFKHSEDFAVFSAGDRTYDLSAVQAAIVRRLHQAATYDLWSVTWSELKSIAENAGYHPTRMNDIFGRLHGWHQLIETTRSGFWQLCRPAMPA